MPIVIRRIGTKHKLKDLYLKLKKLEINSLGSTNSSVQSKTNKPTTIIIVAMTVNWCGYCKEFLPILDQVANYIDPKDYKPIQIEIYNIQMEKFEKKNGRGVDLGLSGLKGLSGPKSVNGHKTIFDRVEFFPTTFKFVSTPNSETCKFQYCKLPDTNILTTFQFVTSSDCDI